jgi:tetratricopeptide (TPR) repeat protein
MVYESQMIKLTRGAVAAHGKLLEVIFMNKSTYDSRLVFSEGTILPVKHRQAGYDISQESYAYQVAIELGGTDPFSMLTFGYSGTGPTCYSTFLRTAGFRNPDVEDIEAPLKLRTDGSRVRGMVRGDWVEWEDGSEKTPLKYGTREEEKHCVSCGALISTDALYCPKCGVKQDGANEKKEGGGQKILYIDATTGRTKTMTPEELVKQEEAKSKAKEFNEHAVQLMQQRRFDEAIRELKKAADLYPYEAMIFMNLGVSYAEKGQFDEGIKYLEKALSIDPRNERVRRNLENVKRARER